MLRQNRVYRILRVAITVIAGVMRYLSLMARARVRFWAPSEKAWDRAHRKTGQAIYRLATHLRGGFVKFGQVVGARADYFPASFIEPLRGLHDQVPGRPFATVRKHVERELGRPIDEVFEHVEELPIAAASLAQVHRGRLKDGREVAIKVQYPEAQRIFPVDLASMRRTMRVARWLNKGLDFRSIANELSEFVTLELDFSREAVSTERVRQAFAGDPRIAIPIVHTELSSSRLLVLEFLEGRRIGDVDALREMGVDLKKLAETVANVYCQMIFEHGFFHGDPHPGNILVRADGTIGLVDFGLAKELPDGFAPGVASMIVKGMAGDSVGALEAARSIGFEVGGQSPEHFQELVRMLMGQYGGTARLLDALKQSPVESVPSHFTIIGRVFLLLNGLSHRLVPGERVIATAVGRTLVQVLAKSAA